MVLTYAAAGRSWGDNDIDVDGNDAGEAQTVPMATRSDGE